MANIVRQASDGNRYLVPEGTPDDEINKGVPLSIDLSFLDFPVQLEQTLRAALASQGLVEPKDFERPGVYKFMAEALKRTFKVTANEIVDHIRREQL